MVGKCKESAFSILFCCLSFEVGIETSLAMRMGKSDDEWRALMTGENV